MAPRLSVSEDLGLEVRHFWLSIFFSSFLFFSQVFSFLFVLVVSLTHTFWSFFFLSSLTDVLITLSELLLLLKVIYLFSAFVNFL